MVYSSTKCFLTVSRNLAILGGYGSQIRQQRCIILGIIMLIFYYKYFLQKYYISYKPPNFASIFNEKHEKNGDFLGYFKKKL
jgi:hypothetical protein